MFEVRRGVLWRHVQFVQYGVLMLMVMVIALFIRLTSISLSLPVFLPFPLQHFQVLYYHSSLPLIFIYHILLVFFTVTIFDKFE